AKNCILVPTRPQAILRPVLTRFTILLFHRSRKQTRLATEPSMRSRAPLNIFARRTSKRQDRISVRRWSESLNLVSPLPDCLDSRSVFYSDVVRLTTDRVMIRAGRLPWAAGSFHALFTPAASR